jgi:carbon-monoxide dehydrogenase medium subunit
MRPAPFALTRPRSLDEALAALAHGGPATRPLAGGQTLMAQLNRREIAVDGLVDLATVGSLRAVDVDADGTLRLGAMAALALLEDDPRVAAGWPLLAACVAHVGHRPIRVRSTVGGGLAFADPAAELPLALAMLDARVDLAGGPGGARRSAGVLDHDCAPGELIVGVRVPPAAGPWGFFEASRRVNDRAVGGAAARLVPAAGGAPTLRLGLQNAGPATVLLDTPRWTPDAADPGALAAAATAADVDPFTRRTISESARRATAAALALP